jgi:hypothetical protein
MNGLDGLLNLTSTQVVTNCLDGVEEDVSELHLGVEGVGKC